MVVPTRLIVGDREVGYDHVVDPDYDDPIAQGIIRGDYVTSGSLIWLLSCIRAGDAVLDLGAHIGTFCLPAAMLGAQVLAVEGSPINAALLRSAIGRNDMSSVECKQIVVDALAHEVEFVILGPYGTIATPSICATTGYPSIRVPTTTIDQLPGGPFTWVKVDVEGAEEAVLRGAMRAVREIKGMVIESNGHMLHSHGTNPTSLIHRLKRMGLSIYEVGCNTLRPTSRPFVQPETVVDYVAVSGDPMLPPGWSMAAPRSRAEVFDLLIRESEHPIDQHREYARRCIGRLPARYTRQFKRHVSTQGSTPKSVAQ